jgi:iron-sulfur cluster assembly protein
MEYKGNIVKFSPSAVKQIHKLIANEPAEKQLRIGVKNGGCSGFQYIFEFDLKTENDIESPIDGFQILIDKTQAALINDLKIDYENGLNNRGFIYTNPNAKTTCGCGTSFG